MADTLRSIVEGMKCDHRPCTPDGNGLVNQKCTKHRLLALLDAAEKTNLVRKLQVKALEFYLEALKPHSLCSETYTKMLAEAYQKLADELRDWLAARGIQS